MIGLWHRSIATAIDDPDDEEIIMTATLTTAEVAEALETTPRTLRKFLRSDQGPGKVGKGSRYALPASKREMGSLAKKFAKWVEATEAAKAAKDAETDEADTED